MFLLPLRIGSNASACPRADNSGRTRGVRGMATMPRPAASWRTSAAVVRSSTLSADRRKSVGAAVGFVVASLQAARPARVARTRRVRARGIGGLDGGGVRLLFSRSKKSRQSRHPHRARCRTPALRMQRQLLHPPVQQLGHIQLVLRGTGDLVNPSELLHLLSRLAEHAQDLPSSESL